MKGSVTSTLEQLCFKQSKKLHAPHCAIWLQHTKTYSPSTKHLPNNIRWREVHWTCCWQVSLLWFHSQLNCSPRAQIHCFLQTVWLERDPWSCYVLPCIWTQTFVTTCPEWFTVFNLMRCTSWRLKHPYVLANTSFSAHYNQILTNHLP